jgi:hypothetical protein
VEAAPKVFLQNKLTKSQLKLKELGPIITNKRERAVLPKIHKINVLIEREFDQLTGLSEAYNADRALEDIDKIADVSCSLQNRFLTNKPSEIS